MWRSTPVSAFLLCILTVACQRPDPIRLQPTFEEPAALVSMIRISDPSSTSQLLRGFYPLEENWRWAGPRFTVALGVPEAARQNGAELVLAFFLPDASVRKLKQVTIAAKVEDFALPPETYSTTGDHEYRRSVPAAALTHDPTGVDFTVDKFVTSAEDSRQLSVVVTRVGFEPK